MIAAGMVMGFGAIKIILPLIPLKSFIANIKGFLLNVLNIISQNPKRDTVALE
jgi:hypothetical protein